MSNTAERHAVIARWGLKAITSHIVNGSTYSYNLLARDDFFPNGKPRGYYFINDGKVLEYDWLVELRRDEERWITSKNKKVDVS